jgi:DNA polymerase-3 subunit delta'
MRKSVMRANRTTKRSIPIDEIRALQHRLTTRPTLGSRAARFIDPADDLETGAVNALLKSLEEPPAGTFFLLVTHRLGRLLPTIRSRCRILRFAPLADETVDRILRIESPQADTPTPPPRSSPRKDRRGGAGFRGRGLARRMN